MLLRDGLHLAYCTNIHRGETWSETFDALQRYTLAVKQRVCPNAPYAIGLRLSDQASRELADARTMVEFQRWLDRNECYVFTVNGFPFGKFHAARVKEQVYLPNWASSERLEYTNRLFDLLAQLTPQGVEGSVSTLPIAFKGVLNGDQEEKAARDNLFRCVEHIARVCEKTGKMLHLGLEPEPLCVLETTSEVIEFFGQLRAEHGFDARINQHLGINYDACHLAVEFENPSESLTRLRQENIRLSKIHLSCALKANPSLVSREKLESFVDRVYLHQVIVREGQGALRRYPDLDVALEACNGGENSDQEWRIHFHVPLHSPPADGLDTTAEHLLGVLDWLHRAKHSCSHLEMETYTWEVLPQRLKTGDVTEQLASEYRWCLDHLRSRGLA